MTIVTETRHDEQAAETGATGQRGAGEDRQGGSRDEAHHLGDGRRDREVAGERERAGGEQRYREAGEEHVVDGVLDVSVHAGRGRAQDHPGPVHSS